MGFFLPLNTLIIIVEPDLIVGKINVRTNLLCQYINNSEEICLWKEMKRIEGLD